MSEFIDSAQGYADDLANYSANGGTWRGGLRSASFRGAGFKVTGTVSEDGRRVASHVFPLRDTPFSEDLGRAQRTYAVTGLVIGEDYFSERDALVEACAGSAEVGTLSHPFLGELRVRCVSVQYTESLKEGRFAAFEMKFVEAGEPPSPTESIDTYREVISTARRALKLAQSAYALYSAARGDLVGFAQTAALGYLQGLGRSLGLGWLSIPSFSLSALTADFTAIAASPVTDPAEVAEVATAPYLSLATATPLPAIQAEPGTAFASRVDAAPAAEPLALLLAETLRAPPYSPDATEAVVLAALHNLTQDAAVAAAAEAAVSADWPNAGAAIDARDQVLAAVWAREDAAADGGDDDLYAAWKAVASAVQTDLTKRAARLPRRGLYSLPGTLPALALSQRLYGTATRADELVGLAGVPHPGFMPAAGPLLRP